MLWIVIVLALAVAFSFWVHSAAEKARAESAHGGEPALIVSIPMKGRLPSAEERNLIYAIGDDIQARKAAALVDIGVRNRRMYLRLATTDLDAATTQIREVLASRGLLELALIEPV